MIRQGFKECFRVLKPNGTLIFKWNEVQFPVKDVLKLTDKNHCTATSLVRKCKRIGYVSLSSVTFYIRVMDIEKTLFADGFDAAILGMLPNWDTDVMRICYSKSKMIDC